MKQYDRHNDDEFYQQIMAELRAGANEYDRLMTAGKNPGATRATRHLIFRYAAAACVLIAISALALVLWQMERQQQTPQIAHQQLPTSPQHNPMPQIAESEPPQTIRKRSPLGSFQEEPQEVPQEEPQTAQEPAADEDDQTQLMAQAEEELMRVMMEEELIQEVVATALRDIEQPQTIQFSL